MAILEITYRSELLRKDVTVNVILPDRAKKQATEGDKPYKTLYLFHGLSGDRSTWIRQTSIERYAKDYQLAVVMPSVERSWYTDMANGSRYLTFVTEELPSVCRSFFRGMSEAREDNLVAGMSMGGYGAVKAALTRPDRFFACASFSGALDIAAVQDIVSLITTPIALDEWRGVFGFDLQSTEDLRNSKHDTFALVRQNIAAGLPFPKLYMWCGVDDPVVVSNRKFDAFLNELNLPHVYEESEGDHRYKWWDLHIQDALRYLLTESEA